MSHTRIAALGLVASLYGCGSAQEGPSTESRSARGPIAATVNDVAIHVADVERVVAASSKGMTPPEALDALIELEVVSAEARRRRISAEPSVLETGRRAAVQRLLASEFERQNRKAHMPQEDIEAAFKQNFWFYNNPELRQVSHVLARVEEGADAARWASAEAAIRALQEDFRRSPPQDAADFRQRGIASRQIHSPMQARDLEWISMESDLVPPFRDAAFALAEDGQISPPIKTQFGWHLIFREARREARTQTLEDVQDDVVERSFVPWRGERFGAFVDRLVRSYAVAVDPGPLAALQR